MTCITGGREFDLPDDGPRAPWHRDVTLDEILPAEAGCSHEIACFAGSVRVVCRDLAATWTEADCSAK
ncbi:hypothetical protein [Amycolatopsis sp. H20-H5]|uniref:hypothetical protein n=1 Tax=Amycolatopsis sp. H20-H5 TaxID=3046309 RepID=UPI002DBB8E21|nr:hypothetical protein [Amycolatopsis sp. H20-H5]MEC3975583.1 hypothetical protein [Amycolatopsis sp. H20-H5]